MSGIGKIFAVIIVLAVIYIFVAKPALPTLTNDNSQKLVEIDAQFGVGQGALAPSDVGRIAEYELALKKISPANEGEKAVIEMKVELAEMRRHAMIVAENAPKISFPGIDCSPAAPLGLADISAGEAVTHAANALALHGKISPSGSQKYLASAETAIAIEFVKDSMGTEKKNFDYLCGKGPYEAP